MTATADTTPPAHKPEEPFTLRSRVLRFGPMPPPPGPDRLQLCVASGLKALYGAYRHFGQTLTALVAVLPDGLASLPAFYPLAEPTPHDTAIAVGRVRVRRWFTLRSELEDNDTHLRITEGTRPGADWWEAEHHARSALSLAVDAYNWLDDAAMDLPADMIIDIASFTGTAIVGAPAAHLADTAHDLAHRAGELVGGLFGCKYVYNNGTFYDQCKLSLMHLRMGNSVGITITYACNICDAVLGTCEHGLDTTYDVTVTHIDGSCSVCHTACDTHTDGDLIAVRAEPRMSSPRLREVSLTPRPRDPLNRIQGRSITRGSLIESLGREPNADDEVWDHACMHPCIGFTLFDSLSGSGTNDGLAPQPM